MRCRTLPSDFCSHGCDTSGKGAADGATVFGMEEELGGGASHLCAPMLLLLCQKVQLGRGLAGACWKVEVGGIERGVDEGVVVEGAVVVRHVVVRGRLSYYFRHQIRYIDMLNNLNGKWQLFGVY